MAQKLVQSRIETCPEDAAVIDRIWRLVHQRVLEKLCRVFQVIPAGKQPGDNRRQRVLAC